MALIVTDIALATFHIIHAHVQTVVFVFNPRRVTKVIVKEMHILGMLKGNTAHTVHTT